MTATDILIVGAGPVGAALALLLKDSGRTVRLLEARAGAATDGRTLALSHGSRLILESCDAWPDATATTPITHIHVSHKGAFGRSVLSADECEVPALGYVIAYSTLQAIMDDRLAAAGIEVSRGAKVDDIAVGNANIRTGYRLGETPGSVEARLLVLADGGANLNRVPGLTLTERDYGQTALVGQVELDQPHQGMAWERFTPDGPAALLPKGSAREGRYSLVWTTAPEAVAQLLALEPSAFLERLTRHFGERAGRFISVGKRASFPLRLRVATPRVAERIAVVGAAAQTLHPVAGQGFNMGLRDAADLARLVIGAGEDVGAATVLAAFAAARAADTRLGVRFTDSLVDLFSTDHPVLTVGRGLGLAALDVLPPLRRALARRMVYGR
ncbi:MAG: FAD-dependent monooxygenase [Betaproteobacteria bacterium]|nr:FAD-dependent monooxygenase [Betaproteobacteria bacterium]